VTCLGIITARGGSKGVPDKNLRPLAGRSAVAYAVEAALGCRRIDRVMITTDSPAIRDAAVAAGAEAPFLRPPELATDTARQEDAVLHAMDHYEAAGETFDMLCLLEPTVPLRTPASLERGFDLLESRPDGEAVFSVAETEVSPIWCNTLRDDGTLRGFVDERYLWANRQEVPTYYKLTPVVTLSRWDTYRRKETFVHDTALSLPVDPVEGLDIDSPLDFLVVETVLQRGFRTSADIARYVGAGA